MKSIIIFLLLVLAVVAGIWYFKGSKDDNSDNSTTQQQNSNSSSSDNSNSSNSNSSSDSETQDSTSASDSDDTVVQEVPNGLEGQLKVSNDSNRGNLMLLLKDSDRIIYLYSSRDYSSLIGKNVLVTIDGSLDDFRLVDIKEQGN